MADAYLAWQFKLTKLGEFEMYNILIEFSDITPGISWLSQERTLAE